MTIPSMTDLHQHVLWGIDDGPRTPEAMRAQIYQAVNNHIGLVAATSHAYPKYQPFDMDQYLSRLEEAQRFCVEQDWPIDIIGGCEIHYSGRVPDMLRQGRLPTLGGTRQVLIEFSPRVKLNDLCDGVDSLYRAGYLPILAHVERYACVSRSVRDAISLRSEYGLTYQMNCDTLLYPRGLRERHFVRRMLEEGAIDLVATDAHDTVRRPIRMKQAYRLLNEQYGEEYAQQLTGYGWQLLDTADPWQEG